LVTPARNWVGAVTRHAQKVPLVGRMLLPRAVVDGVEQVSDVATSQRSSAAREATSLRSQAVKVMWPKQC